ncbi:MAG: NAD(P)/FAD-dependent oxidoreductase, partial [Bacilli bacterium]|nr:NAD(P)/FAD-dependent oxidoreductase [Bacilli bacterium]
TDRNTYKADYVVIATGGVSYPLTGSTGDGYKFADKFNHKVVNPVPALVGIHIKENIPTNLKGLNLRNVTLTAKSGNFKHSEFGELTFYEDYIDGPIVITTSSLINRLDNVELELDLKPALLEEQLLARISRDIDKNPNDNVYNLLKGMMHVDFLGFFISKLKLDVYEKCCNFSKEKRLTIVNLLKHFSLTYNGLLGFERAVVTSGGVTTKEINSKTMESKLVPGLFFAGEVIDVDAFTGGFNIQIALSTGAAAGDYINQITNY